MLAATAGRFRYRATEVNDVIAGRWRRLWSIKSGRQEPEDLSGNFKVQLGRWTEAFNLRWLADMRGAACEPLREGFGPLPEDTEFRVHPQGGAYARRGRYSARPDAVGRDAKGLFIVEAKHVVDREISKQVVRSYLGQLFVTMYVLGVDRAVLSVIYGADRLTAYGLTWSDRTWQALEAWVDVFDGHLLLDVEPFDPPEPPCLTLPLPKITNRWRPVRDRTPCGMHPAETKVGTCFSA
jgi:hypothetical protein